MQSRRFLSQKLLPVFALVACLSLRAAEPNHVLNLWTDKPPGEPMNVGAEQDFTKPTDRLIAGRRIIKLGNVATPQAHVFLPPKEKRNGTAVVICPGGGFSILAWDLEGTEVADWLNSIGVTAFVVKYRVPTAKQSPSWLAPVQDAQRTVSLARGKAAEWGLDAKRIGVLGFSAGGATAGLTMIKNGERQYAAADDTDKLSCRPDFAVLVYPAYFVDDKTGQLKSDIVITKETPPAFFVHAANDPIKVDNSVQLFLAMKKAGVSSELHVYDAGGHGYGLRPVAEFPVTTWPKPCEVWMRRNGLLKTTQP
ncbi:MAG: alpha/beta hydrolase [Verrucomicrobia bacterium]|nr:alpha/beta hydrolase [Verrucomicrobiota bacterium]